MSSTRSFRGQPWANRGSGFKLFRNLSVVVAGRALVQNAPRRVMISGLRPQVAFRRTRAEGLSDIYLYLQDTISHLFQVDASDVDWKRTNIQGEISHDEHARLRKVDAVSKVTTEGTGVDADQDEATNVESKEGSGAGVLSSMTTDVKEVLSNSSVSENEPDNFHLAPFEGDIKKQRDSHRKS